MQTRHYSRGTVAPASENPPDSLEYRAEELLGEAIGGDLATTPLEKQLDCVNRVTAAVVEAAKRNAGMYVTDPPAPTECQMEVLLLLAAGKNTEEIAAELHRSKRTVEGHISNLIQVFDECSREGVLRKARVMGLI